MAARRSPARNQVAFPLTAQDMANLCHVDLKTVHNWVAQGAATPWLTQGGHMRFDRFEAIRFFRAYGFAVPKALAKQKPRIAIVLENTTMRDLAKKALARTFELSTYGSALQVLLDLEKDPKDAIIGDDQERGPCILQVFRFLAQNPRHSSTRRIVFSAAPNLVLQRPHATGLVAHATPGLLRAVLEEDFGTL